MGNTKCKKSKPTRFCALKYFIGLPVEINKIAENKYNVIASVKINSLIKYYMIITDVRFNVIKNRIAYPERFKTTEEAQKYRAKIITGFSDSKEHKITLNEGKKTEKTYYIYELPNSEYNYVMKDEHQIIESALRLLKRDPNLLDTYLYSLKTLLHTEFRRAFDNGYESGFNEAVLGVRPWQQKNSLGRIIVIK